jgi:hypothetical protein
MPLIVVEGELDTLHGERRQRLLGAGEVAAVHPIHEDDCADGHARSSDDRLPAENRWIGNDLTDC